MRQALFFGLSCVKRTQFVKYTAPGLVRRGRLGKAARRDITSQPIRVWWYVFTSHGFSADSDAATPRQTQTDNDASGNPQRVAGRPLPLSVRVMFYT